MGLGAIHMAHGGRKRIALSSPGLLGVLFSGAYPSDAVQWSDGELSPGQGLGGRGPGAGLRLRLLSRDGAPALPVLCPVQSPCTVIP